MQSDQILTALIVDDEEPGRRNLALSLELFFPEVKVLGMAASAAEAKQLLLKEQPDVLFLDIEMPLANGFDLLDLVPDRRFEVVFVTAYADYGIQAIKAGALDYLLKPLSKQELGAALQKALKKKAAAGNASPILPSRISIPHSRGVSVLEPGDILRILADNSYSELFLRNVKTLVVSIPIGEFEKRLAPWHFVRIHKSHLVNLEAVVQFSREDGGKIRLNNGTELPVSRRKLRHFETELQAWSLRMK
ncbi:MAG: LytTR family DNA-binding domain-containing protein [Bacteroidota bacterium]